MSDDSYSGHCYCGDIRFEAAGPVMYACFCHCESCQRASGGAVVPWATFDKAGFAVTSGGLAFYRSSAGVTRGFCGRCGSSLTYEHEDREGQVDVALSCLDDPSLVEPRSHIWVEDKLPWMAIGDELKQYDKTVTAG